MNEPRDDQRPDDAEFENWLAGNSPLSRRYAELGDEQPPADIDRKILASAAEASKVVPLERPTRRWGAAIAVAATVLLCVSIVVNLSIQPEGPLLGEAPPQVEFSADPDVARESENAVGPAGDVGRFDELRRRSEPATAPPTLMEESVIAPGALESAPSQRMTANQPRAPDREALNAGLASPAVRPSLDLPQATKADPARDDEQLVRAVELLQARRGAGSSETLAPADDRQKAAPGQPQEERLDAILAAWDADDPELAWSRLQDFLRDNPDHPFSRELTGPN